MREFIDADPSYIRWRDTHPDSFVLNCNRHPHPAYLKLHRAICPWLRWSGRLTHSYIKICASDPSELEAWARTHTGGTLQPCGHCHP